MALVRVFSPQSESELAVVTSLLEAHEIPVFVHGRHLGSLLPGMQINAYNTQSVMVPEEAAADAVELLAEFRKDNASTLPEPLPWLHRLRVIFEGVVFGWLVSGQARSEPSESRDGEEG